MFVKTERHPQRPLSRSHSLNAWLGAMVVIAVLLSAVPAASAIPATTPEQSASVAARGGRDFARLPDHCRGDGYYDDVCRVTRFPARPWLVLWGDSHALMYLPALEGIVRQRRINLVVIYSGGCPIARSFPKSGTMPLRRCDHHNTAALDYVRDLVRSGRDVQLVLGSFWHYYRTQYARYVEAKRTGEPSGLTDYEIHIARLGVERSSMMFELVGRLGVPADVLAQAATVPISAPHCPAGTVPYQCDLPRRSALPAERSNERFLTALARRLVGTPRVIDPSPTYCDVTTCSARVGDANTYFDAGHLGASLTRTMRSYFAPTVSKLLRRHRAG